MSLIISRPRLKSRNLFTWKTKGAAIRVRAKITEKWRMHDVSSLSAANNSHFTRLKWVFGAFWPPPCRRCRHHLPISLLFFSLLVSDHTWRHSRQKIGSALQCYYLLVSKMAAYLAQHRRGSKAVTRLRFDWRGKKRGWLDEKKTPRVSKKMIVFPLTCVFMG